MTDKAIAILYLENLRRVLEDKTGKYTYRLGEQPVCSEVVSERYRLVPNKP
jgi:hypothetical protein